MDDKSEDHSGEDDIPLDLILKEEHIDNDSEMVNISLTTRIFKHDFS